MWEEKVEINGYIAIPSLFRLLQVSLASKLAFGDHEISVSVKLYPISFLEAQ